jgi:hypothetical protein
VGTTNLDIDYISPSVNDKTVKANEAFDDFDGALAGYDAATWTFSADADETPDAETCKRSMAFTIVEGSLASSGKSIIVPATAKIYLVYNSSATYGVTVKVSGQTGVLIALLKRAVLYCDGTDVRRFSADQ